MCQYFNHGSFWVVGMWVIFNCSFYIFLFFKSPAANPHYGYNRKHTLFLKLSAQHSSVQVLVGVWASWLLFPFCEDTWMRPTLIAHCLWPWHLSFTPVHLHCICLTKSVSTAFIALNVCHFPKLILKLNTCYCPDFSIQLSLSFPLKSYTLMFLPPLEETPWSLVPDIPSALILAFLLLLLYL